MPALFPSSTRRNQLPLPVEVTLDTTTSSSSTRSAASDSPPPTTPTKEEEVGYVPAAAAAATAVAAYMLGHEEKEEEDGSSDSGNQGDDDDSRRPKVLLPYTTSSFVNLGIGGGSGSGSGLVRDLLLDRQSTASSHTHHSNRSGLASLLSPRSSRLATSSSPSSSPRISTLKSTASFILHSSSSSSSSSSYALTASLTLEDQAVLSALRDMMRTPTQLQALIKALIVHADPCVKLRFCSAVNEYQCTQDKQAKLAKGRKIVAVFIQTGSMFQLEGIPKDLQTRHTWRDFRDLDALKYQFEVELVHNEFVSSAVKRMILASMAGDTTAAAAPPSSSSGSGLLALQL